MTRKQIEKLEKEREEFLKNIKQQRIKKELEEFKISKKELKQIDDFFYKLTDFNSPVYAYFIIAFMATRLTEVGLIMHSDLKTEDLFNHLIKNDPTRFEHFNNLQVIF